MYKAVILLALLCATCNAVVLPIPDGLLRNGNFEKGPEPSQLKHTRVVSKTAIPSWEISGFVEYIKAGQTQQDMLLVVPEGESAVRLGNEASISQWIDVRKRATYSITFGAARTCAQDEKLNVSVTGGVYGVVPIQTMYGSQGWDSYAWAFRASGSKIRIQIHNPGVEEDPACGPLIDSVAIKILKSPKWSRENLLKNGDFEEGPYVFPKTSWGVLIPPHIEDANSALPGWIVESLKAVKYIDASHFAVPHGRRAVELVAGKESAIAQIVRTQLNRRYVLTFSVGDANDACVGPMVVEAYAGRERAEVEFASKGKGGFTSAKLAFRATSTRTRVMFLSRFYHTKSDHTGTLCGPVIDGVRLLHA